MYYLKFLILFLHQHQKTLTHYIELLHHVHSEEFQNLIEEDFEGSVLDFEKKHKTTRSKYIADRWEYGKKRILIDYKKGGLVSGVSVTKKEILNAFDFHKKENPFIPQSFSFSLYHTPVFPEEEDLELNLKKLSAIKDSLLSGQLLFEDAFKRHSKKTPESEALNGWWLRGDLGKIFPKTSGLEKNFTSCLGALKIIKDGWETEAIPKKSDKNIEKIGFFAKIFGIHK